MKIGFVSQWFDPERGSAAQASNIARSLQRHGHEVTVLTGFPNYPEGRLYPGYRLRLHQVEERDGLTVHRVPLVPTHRPRASSRLLNYVSFASAAATAAPRVLRDVDVVHVHLTPATPALAAFTLRALRGVPYVLHVQDLWPDTVVSSGFVGGRERWLAEPIHRFCDLMYRDADAVAVTSPGMAEKIAARGVDPRRIHFAPNWADEGTFAPQAPDEDLRRQLGLRPFTVMYAGNFGEFQSLDTLLDVAAATRDRSEVGYALVGEGVREQHLRDRVERERLDNVQLLPAQPLEQMGRYLSLGDLHYVGLQDLPLFRLTLPSKIQATLAMGRPILGSLSGDAAAVIEGAGAGVCVSPGDVSGLVAAVERLSTTPGLAEQAGQAGRRYYERHFSEQASSGVLNSLLTAAARPRREIA